MSELLAVALSARALAGAIAAAGHRALAIDLFDDLDLRACAAASRRFEASLEAGFDERLMAAAGALARGREPIGLVYAAGFEDRPALLDLLAGRWPLLGNPAETVRRVKDPAWLAAACARLAIPHPPIRFAAPTEPGWLAKRAGASGGSHVGHSPAGDATYWQAAIAGRSIAALVVGDGSRARLVGFSEQWTDPVPAAPYRYGGAVRPAALGDAEAARLAAAAEAIAADAGLVGLNGVDFVLAADGWWLIEVNPRPGAALDVFRDRAGELFLWHLAGCRGAMPAGRLDLAAADAAATVYARRPIAAMPAIDWPDWTADRQPEGTRLEAGAPLCTVLASAATAAEARRLVGERRAIILQRTEGG